MIFAIKKCMKRFITVMLIAGLMESPTTIAASNSSSDACELEMIALIGGVAAVASSETVFAATTDSEEVCVFCQFNPMHNTSA